MSEFWRAWEADVLSSDGLRGPTTTSNWIIPGVLMAGGYPGNLQGGDAHTGVVSALLEHAGITTFVCLQNRDELEQKCPPYMSVASEISMSICRPGLFQSYRHNFPVAQSNKSRRCKKSGVHNGRFRHGAYLGWSSAPSTPRTTSNFSEWSHHGRNGSVPSPSYHLSHHSFHHPSQQHSSQQHSSQQHPTSHPTSHQLTSSNPTNGPIQKFETSKLTKEIQSIHQSADEQLIASRTRSFTTDSRTGIPIQQPQIEQHTTTQIECNDQTTFRRAQSWHSIVSSDSGKSHRDTHTRFSNGIQKENDQTTNRSHDMDPHDRTRAPSVAGSTPRKRRREYGVHRSLSDAYAYDTMGRVDPPTPGSVISSVASGMSNELSNDFDESLDYFNSAWQPSIPDGAAPPAEIAARFRGDSMDTSTGTVDPAYRLRGESLSCHDPRYVHFGEACGGPFHLLTHGVTQLYFPIFDGRVADDYQVMNLVQHLAWRIELAYRIEQKNQNILKRIGTNKTDTNTGNTNTANTNSSNTNTANTKTKSSKTIVQTNSDERKTTDTSNSVNCALNDSRRHSGDAFTNGINHSHDTNLSRDIMLVHSENSRTSESTFTSASNPTGQERSTPPNEMQTVSSQRDHCRYHTEYHQSVTETSLPSKRQQRDNNSFDVVHAPFATRCIHDSDESSISPDSPARTNTIQACVQTISPDSPARTNAIHACVQTTSVSCEVTNTVGTTTMTSVPTVTSAKVSHQNLGDETGFFLNSVPAGLHDHTSMMSSGFVIPSNAAQFGKSEAVQVRREAFGHSIHTKPPSGCTEFGFNSNPCSGYASDTAEPNSGSEQSFMNNCTTSSSTTRKLSIYTSTSSTKSVPTSTNAMSSRRSCSPPIPQPLVHHADTYVTPPPTPQRLSSGICGGAIQESPLTEQEALGLIEPHETLYIHCMGGHGRTGTIITLLLVYMFRIDVDTALDYVRFCHQQRASQGEYPSPDCQIQMEQVRRLSACIQTHQHGKYVCGQPSFGHFVHPSLNFTKSEGRIRPKHPQNRAHSFDQPNDTINQPIYGSNHFIHPINDMSHGIACLPAMVRSGTNYNVTHGGRQNYAPELPSPLSTRSSIQAQEFFHFNVGSSNGTSEQNRPRSATSLSDINASLCQSKYPSNINQNSFSIPRCASTSNVQGMHGIKTIENSPLTEHTQWNGVPLSQTSSNLMHPDVFPQGRYHHTTPNAQMRHEYEIRPVSACKTSSHLQQLAHLNGVHSSNRMMEQSNPHLPSRRQLSRSFSQPTVLSTKSTSFDGMDANHRHSGATGTGIPKQLYGETSLSHGPNHNASSSSLSYGPHNASSSSLSHGSNHNASSSSLSHYSHGSNNASSSSLSHYSHGPHNASSSGPSPSTLATRAIHGSITHHNGKSGRCIEMSGHNKNSGHPTNKNNRSNSMIHHETNGNTLAHPLRQQRRIDVHTNCIIPSDSSKHAIQQPIMQYTGLQLGQTTNRSTSRATNDNISTLNHTVSMNQQLVNTNSSNNNKQQSFSCMDPSNRTSCTGRPNQNKMNRSIEFEHLPNSSLSATITAAAAATAATAATTTTLQTTSSVEFNTLCVEQQENHETECNVSSMDSTPNICSPLYNSLPLDDDHPPPSWKTTDELDNELRNQLEENDSISANHTFMSEQNPVTDLEKNMSDLYVPVHIYSTTKSQSDVLNKKTNVLAPFLGDSNVTSRPPMSREHTFPLSSDDSLNTGTSPFFRTAQSDHSLLHMPLLDGTLPMDDETLHDTIDSPCHRPMMMMSEQDEFDDGEHDFVLSNIH